MRSEIKTGSRELSWAEKGFSWDATDCKLEEKIKLKFLYVRWQMGGDISGEGRVRTFKYSLLNQSNENTGNKVF